MEQDELFFKILAGIDYNVSSMIQLVKENQTTDQKLIKALESVTEQSWQKVLSKDKIKIISSLDPEVMAELENMSDRTQKNYEALVSFNDSFLKGSESSNTSINEMKKLLLEISKKIDIPASNHISEENDGFKRESSTQKYKVLFSSTLFFILGLGIGRFLNF